MAEQFQQSDLIKRAEDLRARCARNSTVTRTGFLTPAEQYALSCWAHGRAECRLVFSGGAAGCERQIAFFLPFWYNEADDPAAECVCAVKLTAGFGEPSHRDYLGAALALGIKREWVGDILIDGSTAYLLCLDTVADTLLLELNHVGRFGVKAQPLPLQQLSVPQKKTRSVTFTVQSARLDAVTGAMFGLSRSAAAKLIEAGAASLNYTVCQKTDTEVRAGDVLSLRGYGKGTLAAEGGHSRKGRTFLTAEIYE